MALKWLKKFNPLTNVLEKFYAVTHATAVYYGDDNTSTVANELNKVAAQKGSGTGSVQAVNSESLANGNYAVAMGKGNNAKHFNTIFGKWANDSNISGCKENSSSYGSIFAIGNGTSEESKSNALRMTTGGDMYIMNKYYTSGADYAEYFEWIDGNSYADDRRGLFVTLDGNKIKLIDTDITDNDFILGVVSSFPGIIGNADEDWQGRWLKDEYGSFIIKNGSYVENPNYDSTQQYIPRSDRSEWEAIGIIGVLVVRDDGTCKVNGYCKPISGGTATKADGYSHNTYRVIERINDNLIKIVF